MTLIRVGFCNGHDLPFPGPIEGVPFLYYEESRPPACGRILTCIYARDLVDALVPAAYLPRIKRAIQEIKW